MTESVPSGVLAMETALEAAKRSDRGSGEPTRARHLSPAPETGHPILTLQRQAGNQAVQDLLRGRAIRAKLTVSQPGDIEEKKAGSVVDQILRSHGGAGSAPCSCAAGEEMCDECQQKQVAVSRKTVGASGTPALASHGVLDTTLGSAWHPLDAPTRACFEPRFGRDFSGVRVHTDASAASSARSIQALAYAAGEHLVFDAGQFAPGTESGARLLAHELAHVVQQDKAGSADHRIHRQAAPEGGSQQPSTAEPTIAPASSVQGMQVTVLPPQQYAAMTGQSAERLPEGQYVSMSEAAVPGAGMGMASQPLPGLPIPENATGILWEGHHLVDIANVDGSLVARGFRAPLLVHVASTIERKLGRKGILFDRGGGPFTQMLNTGAKDLGGKDLGFLGKLTNFLTGGQLGQYRDDWFFPYMPGAKAVYRTDLPPGGAAEFAKYMEEQIPTLDKEDYRFSTPEPDNPAYARAFGDNPCPPGANNCINAPIEVHDRALGGRNLVLDQDGQLVDIATGEPGSVPGLASNMKAYVKQTEEFFTPRDLSLTSTPGPMWAYLGAGFIRVGGFVLMVYGAKESWQRIAEASPEERPVVEAEEGGSWGGGFIGNVLASALGGAFVCGETGPGAFFCAAGFGIAGGVTGGVVGKEGMRDLASAVVNFGKMTPEERNDTATLLFGTPEEKHANCEMKELNGEDDPLCSMP